MPLSTNVLIIKHSPDIPWTQSSLIHLMYLIESHRYKVMRPHIHMADPPYIWLTPHTSGYLHTIYLAGPHTFAWICLLSKPLDWTVTFGTSSALTHMPGMQSALTRIPRRAVTQSCAHASNTLHLRLAISCNVAPTFHSKPSQDWIGTRMTMSKFSTSHMGLSKFSTHLTKRCTFHFLITIQ